MIFNTTTIIQFGTGDISVASGKLNTKENIPFISFTQGVDGEIGRDTPEDMTINEDGILSDENAHTRLVFISEDSIDVLINHLKICKEYINGADLEEPLISDQ